MDAARNRGLLPEPIHRSSAYAGVVSVFSSANAWRAFSVLDILLATLAAVTLVAALIWRVAALALVAVAATMLGGVVLYRAFESHDPFFGSLVGPGMVVGFGSLVLIAVVATAAALRARSQLSVALSRS
jgi:hypothetical protein